jgi:hypothetical protein
MSFLSSHSPDVEEYCQSSYGHNNGHSYDIPNGHLEKMLSFFNFSFSIEFLSG